jgi:hypothetical protein
MINRLFRSSEAGDRRTGTQPTRHHPQRLGKLAPVSVAALMHAVR